PLHLLWLRLRLPRDPRVPRGYISVNPIAIWLKTKIQETTNNESQIVSFTQRQRRRAARIEF
ncbi:MAG: hypothetical protein ACRD82_02105, partial [Blastocatellia bacterium]